MSYFMPTLVSRRFSSLARLEEGNIFPSYPTLPNDQITSELGVIYVPIPERAAASMATHDKHEERAAAAAAVAFEASERLPQM